jgi:osmotically-inducible protein OsmY
MMPQDANTPTAPAHDIDDDQVTAQIRSALLSDKSLSTHAHDVTIATNPQAVVLRGSVKPEEKDRIETLAEKFVGTRQIINQLQVIAP